MDKGGAGNQAILGLFGLPADLDEGGNAIAPEPIDSKQTSV
jgi:hypothetical protein